MLLTKKQLTETNVIFQFNYHVNEKVKATAAPYIGIDHNICNVENNKITVGNNKSTINKYCSKML